MAKPSDKTLVVLRFSALGDVAMCVPVLLALKRTHPHLNLIFVTKGRFLPVIAAIPGVRVIPLESENGNSGLPRLFSLGFQIFRTNPAAVADLHNVLRTKLLRVMPGSWLTPWRHLDKGRAEKAALTREENKVFAPLMSGHERSAEVFRKLGYSLQVEASDVLPARSLPEGINLGAEEAKLIGLAPFAAHAGKSYPPALVEELLGLLSGKADCNILLFGGGKKETDLFSRWESQYPNVQSMAGRFSMSEELAVISNLELMISMDSGNGHLAAMFGVPVVSVWGVTHPYAGFAPFGQPDSNSLTADREQFPLVPTSVYGNTYPEGYEQAIASVNPAQIAGKVAELLRQ
ncbi:ADP-heptose:LPS heptosyltransferase [Robiginitalea myxolifaciens]|uniref:ADP-heptose:LPS heptosyltransferase n=1 Tax=Robiginitalea myxolifaciens TaxID=400055 RepID=A0A1I6G2A9_9FLAO|nr:glycosyltransferase family 9 protein [Robiginitalea myxolifaciens]SFR36324.1 ADP-heptose:LPS heptosyltransferase [Robiginitalea myxolifaciens]